MADLRIQVIAVDDKNDPSPENIPDEVTQPKYVYICISYVIICSIRSNNLHNICVAFKNYSHEEVTKMTKLELLLILFPVEYLKETLIIEPYKPLKHIMDPGEPIQWIVCFFYMGCWVIISNRRNWCSTVDPTMSEGSSFRLNNYMSRMRFEGILLSLRYTN